MIFQFLDQMDGKQARRTGSSSPLGMIMDHGCDSLVTFIFTISLGICLNFSGAHHFAILWMIASLNFYFFTWEAYYTGVLDFPCIHGASEGALLACALLIFSGIVGK